MLVSTFQELLGKAYITLSDFLTGDNITYTVVVQVPCFTKAVVKRCSHNIYTFLREALFMSGSAKLYRVRVRVCARERIDLYEQQIEGWTSQNFKTS